MAEEFEDLLKYSTKSSRRDVRDTTGSAVVRLGGASHIA
jgi:hypothetical protein